MLFGIAGAQLPTKVAIALLGKNLIYDQVRLDSVRSHTSAVHVHVHSPAYHTKPKTI